ncbi:MAG: hypothetical protein AAGF12_01015 [Myxococcota bacterium]
MSNFAADSLVHAWRTFMNGARPNVDGIAAWALELAAVHRSVSVRTLSSTYLTVSVGEERAALSDAHARGQLRMACARLIVLFTDQDMTPPLYGGELVSEFIVGSRALCFHLTCENTLGSAHFRLEAR